MSICIVSYNCCALLADCLRSIEATVGELSCEVIVTDNASEDGTVEMLAAEFPDVLAIANENNAGFAGGTNQAMARATGDVLLMLNPDTIVHRDALQTIVNFFGEHPDAAVGPRLVSRDGDLQPSSHPFPTLGRTFAAQLGLHRLARPKPESHEPTQVDWVSGAALAMTREIWERVGPLDEEYFMYSEDVDWRLRAAREGLACWYLPAAEIVHLEGATWADLSTERVLAAHRANWRFFRKHYGHCAEMTLRAMVAGGALGRGILWALAWPFGCRQCSPMNRPGVHFAVLREALVGRRGNGSERRRTAATEANGG